MNWTRIIIGAIIVIAPFIIYRLIISTRLRARYAETYLHIDNWWARQWARIVAFRTWIIGTAALALPELINLVEFGARAISGLIGSGHDISFLPDAWENYIRSAALVILLWNQGRKTTAVNEPEPGTEPEKS